MLTCKVTFPDSPNPVIISKNPAFRALYLTQQNEFRFFPLINTKMFLFHLWLLASARKNSFCRRNNGFARVCGAAARQPSWLICLCSHNVSIYYTHTRTLIQSVLLLSWRFLLLIRYVTFWRRHLSFDLKWFNQATFVPHVHCENKVR